MAQFTRGQLKSLVKECLVEILTEGLATSSDTHLMTPPGVQEQRQIKQRPSASTPLRSGSPALNSVVFGSGQKKQAAPASKPVQREKMPSRFDTAVREQISTLTSDPVMSQIFADTAASTLQEQIHADTGKGRPNLDVEAAPDPITDNFLSESAKNWAALAFSDSSKSR